MIEPRSVGEALRQVDEARGAEHLKALEEYEREQRPVEGPTEAVPEVQEHADVDVGDRADVENVVDDEPAHPDTHDLGADAPAETQHSMSDLREALGVGEQVAVQESQPGELNEPVEAPTAPETNFAHAMPEANLVSDEKPVEQAPSDPPTFADLGRLLTSPEFQASVPAPAEQDDYTTLVQFGDRMVPRAYVRLYQHGWLR